MKRLIVAGLLALLLIGAVGGAILAENQTSTQSAVPGAPAAPAPKIRTRLTDKRKAELTDLHKQMLALREKMIDKYLEYGWITKEQANYLKDQIALQRKYAGQMGLRRGLMGGRMVRRSGGRVPGAGMGPGVGMMGPGAGMMGW